MERDARGCQGQGAIILRLQRQLEDAGTSKSREENVCIDYQGATVVGGATLERSEEEKKGRS